MCRPHTHARTHKHTLLQLFVYSLEMSSVLVDDVLRNKEAFLRRHLVLSRTVIEKLYQQNVIGEFTMKQMLVSK